MVHSISARRARLAAFVAAAVLGAALPVVTSATPAAADPGNLALGRPITATSVAPFAPYSANDGDPSSYWESPPNLFPQYVTVDLGTARNINRLVLKLPPSWSARTQTITVRGGTTDPSSTVVASRSYAFDPATGNAVTINFGVGYRRNVQLVIEGNSAGPAAQLSEFEVYEAPPVLSANPTSLNFGAAVVATTATAQSVTISNSGGTPGTLAPITVTGDFQRLGGTCGTTLSNGSSCTITVVFKPTATGARTGTLAAGTLSIPLSGTGVTTAPPNWAAFKTVWADYTGVSAGSNAVDRNPNTVWEGPPGAVPQVIMVALGGTYQVSRVVLRIPPAWTARAETLMVQTSPTTNPWVTVADMRQYIFEPATANTVTITFPTVVAGYVQLVFIGNTGSPSAQLSELEVYPL